MGNQAGKARGAGDSKHHHHVHRANTPPCTHGHKHRPPLPEENDPSAGKKKQATEGKNDSVNTSDAPTAPDVSGGEDVPAKNWIPYWIEFLERIGRETQTPDGVVEETPEGVVEDGKTAADSANDNDGESQEQWDTERLIKLMMFSLDRVRGVAKEPTPVQREGGEETEGEGKSASESKNQEAPAEPSVLKSGPFGGLIRFLDHILSADERAHFFNKTLPFIFDQVAHLPALFGGAGGKPLRCLLPNSNESVELSETELCALLCATFLCMWPDQHTVPLRPDDTAIVPFDWGGKPLAGGIMHMLGEECLCVVRFPEPNCLGNNAFLFVGAIDQDQPQQHAKLHCMLSYFERRRLRADSEIDRVLRFRRKSASSTVCWEDSTKRLTRIRAFHKKDADSKDFAAIEDATDCAQADFANRYIGGGVFQHGCVQEEIRFAVSPELLPSMLFTAALRHNEALVIENTAITCDFQGYGRSFEFLGPRTTISPGDLIAIDALDFRSQPSILQFDARMIFREIEKAYVGFGEPAEAHAVTAVRKVPRVVQRDVTSAVLPKRGDEKASDASTSATISPRRGSQKGSSDSSDSSSSSSSSDSSSSSSWSSSSSCESDYEGETDYRLEIAQLRAIATGNWGAGAFRGNADLKAIIQWLAASQAHRDMHYFVFDRAYLVQSLKQLEKVSRQVKADVGDVYRALLCVCSSPAAAQAFEVNKEDGALISAVCAELSRHKTVESQGEKADETGGGQED